MSVDDTPLLGKRYKIVKQLSRGGSGQVYLAEDITKDRGNNLCAVKELAPRTRVPEEYAIFCERFRDEATYLRALDGFNGQIPKLYDYFPAPDSNNKKTHYIVQEYVEGKTLRDKILEGNLQESYVVEILIALLPVIAHIHSKGFIHRDINPANIILRNHDELPVLIDFGAVKDMETTIISTPESGDAQLTVIIGKTGYMAPEHLAGRPVFASDLYSLGVTAIEALSGSKPQDLEHDSSTHNLLWRHWDQLVSPGLASVLDQAVHGRLDQRYTDARSMLEALVSIVIPQKERKRRSQASVSPPLFKPLRKPSSPGPQHKCWDTPCGYYVAERDDYCPNCGARNLRRFKEDELHLMRNSVEKHYLRFFPRRREARVISIARAIRDEEGNQSLVILLAGFSGLTLSVLLGGLVSGSVLGFIDSLIEYSWFSLAGGVAVWFLSTGGILLLPNLILQNETRLLSELSLKQHQLQLKLKNLTEANRESRFYIKRIERETHEHIENTRKREIGIRKRLLHTEMTATEVFEGKNLKKGVETLTSALEKSALKQKKYEVKLIEIRVLRLHNQLQATIDRRGMSGEGRSNIEIMLERLYKLINQMFHNMKKANILNSTWGARISGARVLTRNAHEILMSQTNNLISMSREDEFIAPPKDFLEILDLLNSYITYEDFYTEYQALQSE